MNRPIDPERDAHLLELIRKADKEREERKSSQGT
jgi:hypothetical protein